MFIYDTDGDEYLFFYVQSIMRKMLDVDFYNFLLNYQDEEYYLYKFYRLTIDQINEKNQIIEKQIKEFFLFNDTKKIQEESFLKYINEINEK